MSTHRSTPSVPHSQTSTICALEDADNAVDLAAAGSPIKKACASDAPPPPGPASPYAGSGTEADPFVVVWLEGELENPYNWSRSYKWVQTASVAMSTLCIAFASSAYSGGAGQIAGFFAVDSEVVVLGISLFIVGFGAGPLLWAPLSEMYGRRPIFLITYALFTLFHIGGACAQNIQTILITRFFAGTFGSAPLTNSGGAIADMWEARHRGTASALFALAPFLGPVIGPIVGGFAAMHDWRLVFWIMFAFAGLAYLWTYFFVPETYAPALLRAKAKKLQKAAGGDVFFVSRFDKLNTMTKSEIIKVNMTRPFVLLFKEPIVLCLSIYTAIIYGTLYLFFSAFPLVFIHGRGWSSGQGGLAFLGVGLGMCITTSLSPLNNKLYLRAVAKSPSGIAPPESRLPFAMVGSVCVPVGIFWFAWTSQASVHWVWPVLAGVPFGAGMLFVFSAVINYLIDAYLLYAASALAANAVLRSILGAVFPLFTTYMYKDLGSNWASTLVGFLSLACVPMPFLFYKYGAKIRSKSTFSMAPGDAAPPAPAAASSDDADLAPSKLSLDEAAHEKAPTLDPVSALEPGFAADAGEAEYVAQQRRREADEEIARRSEGHQIV